MPRTGMSIRMARLLIFLFLPALACLFFPHSVQASYIPFNTSLNANIGIGTSTPQGALAVVNGNVGIGTWTTAGGNLIVNGGGNVGIGSAWPGQTLDVNGSVRATGLTMSGQSPANGYVLTATDSAGDVTWSLPGGVSGWTVAGNNVYETNGGNVGIGTTITNAGAAFSVMNGNVGIGTWVPNENLTVTGNVGIGSSITDSQGSARITILPTETDVNL